MATPLLSSLFSSLPLAVQMGRLVPAGPFRILLRTTGHKFRPPRPSQFTPAICHRQDALLARGAAGPHQLATVRLEARAGPVPTIVLGGFVPDATEAVFLLRGMLLRAGSLYYFNYPRRGFSSDLLYAQLSDLVDELNLRHGRPPVILAISFGAGLLLEWLKRTRRQENQPNLRGLVLVSPVACVEDLLPPGETRPSTLLGRALKPYLEAGSAVDPRLVEKSRTIFQKMFEAGAQNKEALRTILGRAELQDLRSAVRETIQQIDFQGACERIQSLRQLEAPAADAGTAVQPLADVPTLILYAEKEDAVLAERSPTRRLLAHTPAAWFPQGEHRLVTRRQGSPVQHASLIFHGADFQPPIAQFYERLKSRKARQAA
ncbi:MAG: alpha/beta hydrolase [Opitutaceae bacterium]|nr:alpha/beta hydrolase [Opitutaceae bacterium]